MKNRKMTSVSIKAVIELISLNLQGEESHAALNAAKGSFMLADNCCKQ